MCVPLPAQVWDWACAWQRRRTSGQFSSYFQKRSLWYVPHLGLETKFWHYRNDLVLWNLRFGGHQTIKTKSKQSHWGQRSTLFFSSRGPWFKSLWKRKNFPLSFLAVISWLPFTFKLIHDYAVMDWWSNSWCLAFKKIEWSNIAGGKTNRIKNGFSSKTLLF